MACFLPCFGASKRRKHLPSTRSTPSPHQTHVADGDLKSFQSTEQKIPEEPINDTQLKIKFEEQPTKRGKQETMFDLNANSNEELSTEEVKKLEESTTDPVKAGHEVVPRINDGLEATADSLKDEKKGEHEEVNEVDRKSVPSESSESLFSLSIDSRKPVPAAEKTEYEVESPMPLEGAVTNPKEGSGSFGSSHVGVKEKQVKAEENLAQGKPIKGQDSTGLFITKLERSSEWNINRKVKSDFNANNNEEPSAKEIIKGLNENKQDQEEKPQIREYHKFIVPGNSFALSHYRYRDCSDEECGDLDLDESDFGDTFVDDGVDSQERGEGDGAVNRTWVQGESSESLFSLSTDSRKHVSGVEKAQNEVNSPVPARGIESFLGRGGRTQNVFSVLNPIENLTQGEVVRARAMQPLKYEKENINSQKDVIDIPKSEGCSLKVSNGTARRKQQEEIGVDTSLSSWLVETESTPNSKNSANSARVSTAIGKRSSISPVSHEDRPILGALTVEELRKFSVSVTSPASRRRKSRSPDETPIIGTVGSYWSYTGQTINSESPSSCGLIQMQRGCRDDMDSSAVRAKLERDFEASVAPL